ncbi:MAG: restriction endonuclease subunit S [Candidatus Saccharimonadales bacterium]
MGVIEEEQKKLGEYISEISSRVGTLEVPVLSVTNTSGFTNQTDYFSKKIHSKKINNYKIVRHNQFAYNPSRVNVGSIDRLHNYQIGALSPMYVVFSVDEQRLHPEYLGYFVRTHSFYEQVKNNTSGSVRDSLAFKSLCDFKLYIPSVEKQRRIIDELKKIDAVIALSDEIIEEAETLKAGLMQKLFNVNKFVKLGDYAQISTGTTPSTSDESFYTGLNNFVKTSEINGEAIDRAATLISDSAITQYRLKKYKPGTVLLAMYGQGKTRGNSSILNVEASITQNAAAIEPSGKLLSEYLWHYLKSQYERLRGDGVHGHIAHLNLGFVKELKIPFMDIEKQEEASSLLNKVDEDIHANKLVREAHKSLKLGLTQDLLTGKVAI